MAERLIVDDNGEVLDIVCDHEFNDCGICECCGAIKYGSAAYCDIYDYVDLDLFEELFL